ncbi:hypothetical protein DCE94_09190 [Agromyces badenianii]|nr:hypothetical protein DCE94_09190 [Agromyces badenianii]
MSVRSRTSAAVRCFIAALAVAAAASCGAASASAKEIPDQETGFTVTIPSRPPAKPTPTPTRAPQTPVASTGNAGSGSPSRPAANPPHGAPTAANTASCTPTEPAVPKQAATTGEKATTDKSLYVPGQQVTATATGYGAGEQVQLVLFSDPVLIGTFTADAGGQVQAVFPVAEKTTAGTHTVQFTGWCKKVAIADILVGTTTGAASSTDMNIPPWARWTLGAVVLAGLLFLGWRLILVMREPVAADPAVARS